MRVPLDTLPAFEIAAKSESFSAAARKLNLTDSAISHQIRRLEESLGAALFERRGRSIKLNAQGRTFLGMVEPLLAAVSDSAQMLQHGAGSSGTITITCASMFGGKWLAAHLKDFVDRYPNIGCNVKLVDNGSVADQENTDVGILFGKAPWPGRHAMLLGEVNVAPVCSPKLFSGRGSMPRDPKELAEYPIIHQDDGREWRQWLEAVNLPGMGNFKNHVYCNDTGFAIDLAIHGGGLALASEELARSFLRDGTLIRPFAISSRLDGGWYVICRPKQLEEPRVHLFLSWIATHFGSSVPIADDLVGA